jgi:hypothetical protein
MEQGKDLITKAPDGVPCAYQLKAGNINLETWRDIQPQIQELVELPIAHPSINKDIPFRAYLVTTGEIDDPVRRWIDDRNMSWSSKGLPTVNIIAKGELLREFIDAQEFSLPNVSNLRDFLELYLADGKDFLNKDRFEIFLNAIIFRDEGNQNLNKLRTIAAAAVTTQCIIAPFEREQNHVAILESWTMFCAYVLALVEKERVAERFWRPTYDIITQRIHEQLEDLKNEFLTRKNYIEQPALGDGGIVYKARLTIVLAWLCALELSSRKGHTDYVLDKGLLSTIESKSKEWLWCWGESATPYLLMLCLFAEAAGSDSTAWNILLDELAEICVANVLDDSENGFADPYTTVNDIVASKIPATATPSDRKKVMRISYHLVSLVYHATRLDRRIALNELWKMISKICLCEYVPTNKWHYLLWRSNEGGEKPPSFFDRTQSWSGLKKAATMNDGSLPDILYQNTDFVFPFLLVYPHRLTPEVLRIAHETAMT